MSTEVLECLVAYDWPGNVRELENVIERAAVLGSTEMLLPEDLPEAIIDASKFRREGGQHDLYTIVRNAKKQAIVTAFKQANRSYVDAARLLGVHPNYLHRLIRGLDLKPILKGGS